MTYANTGALLFCCDVGTVTVLRLAQLLKCQTEDSNLHKRRLCGGCGARSLERSRLAEMNTHCLNLSDGWVDFCF